jgi:DNA helicase-2/ATP-dependent DNA helicase PcrA
MSISPQEWRKEQERVNEVVQAVEKKMYAMQQHLSSIRTDIIDIRKSFWEDVRVNGDEPHELIETFTTIKQQAEFLSERERSHGHGNYQVAKLDKLKRSPYFGRIDFKFEGEEQPNHVYLGIASFLNENDEFLIYDWRAPISSLYYDSLPGPAAYETPSGTVRGSMSLKRQFMIKNSRVQGMFDTSLAIGDELLQEVLGQHSDAHMKTIVATIQKEQNSVIRNEESKLLIVQGAAGSGKTSAALQRVAYLLYRYRETIEAEHILLFSPNSLFNHYVSSVLPELGEKNMQQTTYQDFLHHKLTNEIEVEDPFVQMEYTLNAINETGYIERIQGIQYKSSTTFLEVLDWYIKLLEKEGLLFHDIMLGEKTIISSTYISNKFYEFDVTIPIPNRIQLVTEHLLTRLKRIAKKEINSGWVEDEIQYLDKEDYLKAYQKLQRNNKKQFSEETFDDLVSEQRFLSKLVVKTHFKPLRQQIRRLEFIDFPSIYEELYRNQTLHQVMESMDETPSEWKIICQQTIEALKEEHLYYEDATPYLYLKERIEGVHKNTSVRHIFIDEAQDYSVLQLAVLDMLFPNSRFTLLGDLNQAIFPHSINGSVFTSVTNEKSKEVIKLTRSYRSTRQIVEFTKRLVMNGDQIEPFNREGKLPVVTELRDKECLQDVVYKQIQGLLQSGTTNIAVINKTSAESSHIYEQLKEKLDLKLIKKETSTFEPGVVVVPAYLAKGIEFDAVIIYNASDQIYGRGNERKLFYTACTRAMHELYINYTGEMSPFLANVEEHFYEKK